MLDLTRPPYREYVDWLALMRLEGEIPDEVRFSASRTVRRGTFDAHEQDRHRLAHVMQLLAVPADLPFVRSLLDEEIAARRADSFQGAGDALTLLSMLLLDFSDGDPSDTVRFWMAKRANFDTFAGGFDVEFVFALHPPETVIPLLEERFPEDAQTLGKIEPGGLVGRLDGWRAGLAVRHPRSDLGAVDVEHWAELFGDVAAQERLGLENAPTAEARAYLYRRLERYGESYREWVAAVADAGSAWDRASTLQKALQDAALVPVLALDEVRQLDALWKEIPGWNAVGLGRMATHACYALAAAIEPTESGREVWTTAQRWHRELDQLALVGLEAAVAAAEKWGTAGDIGALKALAHAEHTRIYGSTGSS